MTSYISSSSLNSLFDKPLDLPALLKANDISRDVQRHLVNVYAALASTILACALGAIGDLWLQVGGIVTMIAALGAFIWLALDQDKTNHPKRTGILLLFGLLKGLSLGSLIKRALYVDPSILVTALLATTTVFLCFAGAALLAKRRSYLYLGGILSSGLMVLLMVSVINMFMWTEALSSLHLYLGLAIFCGYVIFDTQLIVEKAAGGDRDFAWHAAELFIDFVAIFVRICIILLRNKGDSRGERKGGNTTSGTFRR